MKPLKNFSLILLCLFLCSAQVQASSAKKKSITFHCGGRDSLPFSIVVLRNYPPFSWTQINKENGREERMGFILDAIEETIKEVNIETVRNQFFDSFQQTQKAMLRGNAAFSFLSYYIDEAQSGQDYAYPAYFGNPFIVVSRSSKAIEVSDLSDLKGLKGVVREEEGIEPLVRNTLPTDTKLEIVSGAETAFRKLLSGEVDYMLTSKYAAEAEARRFKVREILHFGNTALRHVKYFISFSKMSPCRSYKKIFSEHFKEKIKNKVEMEKNLQKHILLWADMHRDEPPLVYKLSESE